MYQRLTALLLHWLRVPPEPQPPHGDPASLRVFRAGRNYLNLRLLRWGVAQIGALAGIIFWFGVFADLEERVEERRAQRAAVQAATPPPAPAPGRNKVEQTVNTMVAEVKAQAAASEKEFKEARKSKQRFGGFYAWRNGMVNFFSRLPQPAMLAIWFFEIAGLAAYMVQLPLTFLLARLDFEMRWYMVTDRSLRIRHGIWKVSESTMSFANIQQVVVSQGPLQRLLGLSDVKVQSAGGGGGEREEMRGHDDDMHLGLFHSVTNATEIRDLILERLRRFRESGLGDPDEKTPALPAPSPDGGTDDLLTAARELAAEARALRTALG